MGSDNVVRIIDAFVDGFDLRAAGFGRVQAKITGRPGYAPADLLKLYIYGYTHLATPKRTGGDPLRLAFCWAMDGAS